jgi:hypothetical protein
MASLNPAPSHSLWLLLDRVKRDINFYNRYSERFIADLGAHEIQQAAYTQTLGNL